jgi:chaperonin cofactor prefoldin
MSLFFLLAIICLYHTVTSSHVDAFVMTTRSKRPLTTVRMLSHYGDVVRPNNRHHRSTCLWMTAEDGEASGSETNTEQREVQDTTTTAADAGNNINDDDVPDGGVTDILNSPAFLKRKLEVLNSDLEKTQADLEAALERLEIAKEEWGPQLEDLKREVGQKDMVVPNGMDYCVNVAIVYKIVLLSMW